MSRIAIIGAGAWGTTLSIVLGSNRGHLVRLWAHEPEVVESIRSRGANELFLPGSSIPKSVEATDSLEQALSGAEIVVNAAPSTHCRRLFEQMRPHLRPEMLFVSATKGLETDTLLRMSQVISSVVSAPGGFEPQVSALSGPSFATEVARGDPTALTIASRQPQLAEIVQREFSSPRFRLYTNVDVVGVEFGGALKNVIAIAAGVCHGLGLGHNTVAALITRGLAEISRLVVAGGGSRETMAGLAGLGDLVLTCTGGPSRNRRVGIELGRGRRLPEIIASMHGMVAEGVSTTYAAVDLARSYGIEMPIVEQMHAIVAQHKSPAEAIHDLMSRRSKSETSSL